jgi:uncharacterized protein (DUF1684 family)
MSVPANPFALAHWRRTMADLYATVRRTSWADQPLACAEFRAARNALFQAHTESPLPAEERVEFPGLSYYPYDHDWRIIGVVDLSVTPETLTLDLPADGPFHYTRVAMVRFVALGQPAALNAYWIEGYGGGLFLPFRDTTSGQETYGGGRYLFDTIQGADLGGGPEEVVLDFNYSYNPQCAYDPRWVCPLPPPENHLPFAVEAGEKVYRRLE